MIESETMPGLVFDERDGMYLFRRANGEGGYDYSQEFESAAEAITAHQQNRLIYTD